MPANLDELEHALDRILAGYELRKRRGEAARITREAERLVRYGLRKQEADSWLCEEPNFDKPIIKAHLSDDSYHSNPSGEDVTEPLTVMHL